MALQFIANSNGWLSFNPETPRLYITAETDDVSEFDQKTLKAWQEEGFKVTYVPFGKGGKAYVNQLHHLGDGMSIGERYAIVGTSPISITTPPLPPSFSYLHKLTTLRVLSQPSATPPPSVSKSTPSPPPKPQSSAP
jgi:hypothetical protein